MKRPMAFLITISAAACATPMSRNEIQRLTTCPGQTTLKEVRRSLLEHGYEVKSETADDLVTDFRQARNLGGDRRYHRITVLRDGDSVRFRVRVRELHIHKEGPALGMGTYDRPSRTRGSVMIDMSRPVETEHDFDMEYFEEDLILHERIRAEVCGTALPD